MRTLIFERIGGNPLNLKLAAALAGQGVEDQETFLDDLDATRTREQLVRRNLHHIPDTDARKLAEPGLLLREISPEIIRQVMAGPCGLGDLSPTRAKALFTTLRKVTFLVEERGGVIQFRKDIRMALRELVWARSQVQSEELRQSAMAYYRDQPDAAAQSEYLYHRLTKDDPAFLEKAEYDWPTLRPYLENALVELPPDAAVLLGLKFDIEVERSVTDSAGDEAWEQSVAAPASLKA